MANDAIVDALRSTDLFGSLDKRTLGRLADRFTTVEHASGKQIAVEGSSGIAFHLIADGTASVTVNGVAKTALKRGDYFGEISLIDGQPRSATVVADGPLTTYSLTAWEFTPILDTEPSVGKALLLVMCRRLRALEQA